MIPTPLVHLSLRTSTADGDDLPAILVTNHEVFVEVSEFFWDPGYLDPVFAL